MQSEEDAWKFEIGKRETSCMYVENMSIRRSLIGDAQEGLSIVDCRLSTYYSRLETLNDLVQTELIRCDYHGASSVELPPMLMSHVLVDSKIIIIYPMEARATFVSQY